MFLAQLHECSELLILDDGVDCVADLVPPHPRVRYTRETPRRPLGAKRNRLCEMARGDIIVHWDDDDWHAPDRLARQLAALESSGADICGVDQVIFIADDGSSAWDYRYRGEGPWVAGGSLCYRRDYWRKHPFPEIQIGEDTQWIMAAPRNRVHVMNDSTFFVARVHPGNTSQKQTGSAWWHPRSPQSVLSLMNRSGDTACRQEPHRGEQETDQQAAGQQIEPPTACLPDTSPSPDCAVPAMSIVIPFGGADRLANLGAVVCALRQAAPAAQIILAESGAEPLGTAVARFWSADHLFLPATGAFDKSRAINTGSLLARAAVTLWCDCDILVGPDVLARACQEFAARQLDFMFPFSRIDYLDEVQSRAVRSGGRDPADCAPRTSSRPMNGGAIGGVGLVRTAFLREHGGMIEGFLGWGGEDNAWVHKVQVLGKLGTTDRRDQVVHHLYHPESGANARPWLGNPHYQDNLTLLNRVQSVTNPTELAEMFKPEPSAPPWQAGLWIGFIVDPREEGLLALAHSWAKAIELAFASPVQVHVSSAGEPLPDVSQLGLAVLLTSPDHAASILAQRPDLPSIALETGRAAKPCQGMPRSLCVPRTAEQAALWQHSGLISWHLPWDVTPGEALVPAITGPISLRLAQNSNGAASVESGPASQTDSSPGYPVWTYWEGPKHPWIEACLETARLHLPTLRVLDPAAFDELWDSDRDIDLKRLHVAQRADYIRAFLLMRYGGLWIDADCIVMRPLAPLLARLDDVEAITHRERQGLYSNAFLAMRHGSLLAKRFYDMLCTRLRSGQQLGWIALGNDPLTTLMTSSCEPRLELPVEQVQPICWSRPEVMFQQAEDSEHDKLFDSRAWCYMLSNQHVLQRVRQQPQPITAPRSFFSYLVRTSRQAAEGNVHSSSAVNCARRTPPQGSTSAARDPAELKRIFVGMADKYRSEGHASLSGPGSSSQHTAALRRALPQLLSYAGIRSLLDAACGDFHWMSQIWLGACSYTGVELLDDVVQRNQRIYGTAGRRFLSLDILSEPLPRADLILCRDLLVHLGSEDIWRALRNFSASGADYLLATTFPGRANTEITAGGWRPLNLEAPPFQLGTPLRLINEKCTEGGGAFRDKSLGLWHFADIAARL